jgi:hypothetical protein
MTPEENERLRASCAGHRQARCCAAAGGLQGNASIYAADRTDQVPEIALLDRLTTISRTLRGLYS